MVVVSRIELDLNNVSTQMVIVGANDQAFSAAIRLHVDGDNVPSQEFFRHSGEGWR